MVTIRLPMDFDLWEHPSSTYTNILRKTYISYPLMHTYTSVVPKRIFVPLNRYERSNVEPKYLGQGLQEDFRSGWEVHVKSIYSKF